MRLIDGQRITPVDVAAEVLEKLKRDAEQTHFFAPVTRVVIAYPAVFDEMEKDMVRKAARQAGFLEVELLEEPVAAAIAYAQGGIQVGEHVLVYDLGGGTFDLALLVREGGDHSFRLALEPRGERIGGEDFDRLIYEHFEARVREKIGRPICPDGCDLHLLRQCRRYKENLSVSEQPVPLSWWLPGKGRMKLELNRATFEELIAPQVERTVHLTQNLREEARSAGWPGDSVILIGGSSRIPLIRRRLKETLQVEPRDWHKRDIAVALGAAYHAHLRWGKQRGSADSSHPSHSRPSDRGRKVRPGDDLAAVVARLPSGAVLELETGTYRLKEPLRVDRSLTLRGPGRDACFIQSNAEGAVLAVTGAGRFGLVGVTIQHVGGAWADGLVVKGGEVEIRDCRFQGAVRDDNKGGGTGLWLTGDTTGQVVGCESVSNDLHGIEIAERAWLEVLDNLCQKNKASGILYFGTSGGTARNNTCTGNGSDGISIEGQAQPELLANRCENNQLRGILYGDSAAGLARENTCTGNGSHGIALEGTGRPTLEGNILQNNKLSNLNDKLNAAMTVTAIMGAICIAGIVVCCGGPPRQIRSWVLIGWISGALVGYFIMVIQGAKKTSNQAGRGSGDC